jgi:HTH-type transcriptional regulator / antitoxin HipB
MNRQIIFHGEEKAQMFLVSEMLKQARKDANLTQEQLAEKAGTKKSYISKIENGKGNIQLSTLIRIFEKGLNRKIGLTFM